MNHEQITLYAKDLLTEVLGKDIPQCFLAGGAYKTLIHGRPPRDLDLWAETSEARMSLIKILRERGREEAPAPGAERFVVGTHQIEVSFQIESMEERLARFDLGLSCVAVAFRMQETLSFIHPLALDSIRRREILLIRLSHPALALATLLRVRRYAYDLEYAIPNAVQQKLWGVHDSLEREGRIEQIEQLRYHYGVKTWGVEKEARERLSLSDDES